MGNGESLFQKIRNKLYGNNEVRILMCGLDAAGKTTILYTLKLGEVVTTIPTIGFNVETVKYKGINFTTWDVGGRDKSRVLWRYYYQNQNTDVLMFVVDSNDRERMEECKDELFHFMREDDLKDSLVLIMANKQDLPNAMSVQEITERLELNKLPANGRWYIQPSCATTGDGLYEGLSWLQTKLTEKQVRKSVTKPISEVKESTAEKNGLISSWFSSVASYFTKGSVAVTA